MLADFASRGLEQDLVLSTSWVEIFPLHRFKKENLADLPG
jgi:hypothetical protein